MLQTHIYFSDLNSEAILGLGTKRLINKEQKQPLTDVTQNIDYVNFAKLTEKQPQQSSLSTKLRAAGL